MTFFAPALAANMQRIPVPHPTSRTILSLSDRPLVNFTGGWEYSGVENVLEQMLVPPHAVPVAQGSYLILEHLLVDTKVTVGVWMSHQWSRRLPSPFNGSDRMGVLPISLRLSDQLTHKSRNSNLIPERVQLRRLQRRECRQRWAQGSS